jgi:sorting nexin-1/2
VRELSLPIRYGRAEANSESAVNCLLDALVPRAEPLKMDAMAVRYPTAVADVARALESLCSIWRASLSSNAFIVPPILHFSAREAMSKLDMCYVLARIQRSLSEPASVDHLEAVYEPSPSDTSRPKHVKLDCSATEALGIDIACTPFEDVSAAPC